MKKAIWEFLRVPWEIRKEFWQEILQKNQRSLLVICVIIFGMTVFNFGRALLFSHHEANHVHMILHIALCLIGVFYLLLQRKIPREAIRARWALQYSTVMCLFLWHIGSNAYQLMQNPGTETSVFTHAILAMAVFIHMPSWFSAISYGSAYVIFMLLAWPNLTDTIRLNLTMTVVVALAVSLTTSRNTVIVVTQRKEIGAINAQMQMLLRRDPLTGILNKTAFETVVEDLLTHTQQGETVTLAVVDLDDFKQVNDVYGHPCGDYVLKTVALGLQNAFPNAAGIGRIGGDEFALVWRDAKAEDLEKAGEQLMKTLAKVRWQDQPMPVKCSVGACQTGQNGLSYEKLYEEADRTLYQAKGKGKGCCCFVTT